MQVLKEIVYQTILEILCIVQSTRPSEGAYLEQMEREMGPVQFFAQLYAEYHTKSLVCSVGWNHVKFQCCLGD